MEPFVDEKKKMTEPRKLGKGVEGGKLKMMEDGKMRRGIPGHKMKRENAMGQWVRGRRV